MKLQPLLQTPAPAPQTTRTFPTPPTCTACKSTSSRATAVTSVSIFSFTQARMNSHTCSCVAPAVLLAGQPCVASPRTPDRWLHQLHVPGTA
eukprot:768098-Hanusia_phi.AAC.2